MPAPFPLNETARLEALARYAMLDTAPEPAFDRITALASRLFHAPIALVSLIDRDRQWFKSCVGMQAGNVDREITFCAHAILEDQPMIVPDAANDPRFCDNPQVTGPPFIRFYAGAPLITPDGFHLGSLCVIDTAPRMFDRAQTASLQDLAAMVVEALEARRSQAPLMTAINSTESGVLICDATRPEFPIVFANPAFCAITGYRPEEVLGRNCRFLQGPDTDPESVAQMRDALAKRRSFRGILRNYRKDGAPFWNAVEITPVVSDFGTVANFVGVQMDITAQVDALEQARLNAAHLATAQRVGHLGTWEYAILPSGELDIGSIIYTDETRRLLGLTPGNEANAWEEFFERLHPDDREAVAACVADAVAHKKRYSIEHRVVWADGTRHVVHEDADFVFDEATGEATRFVGTVQDITEKAFAVEIGRHLTEARDLPEMLRRCTQSMVDHLNAAFARIWTFNKTENILELRASSGLYTHLDGPHGRVPVGQLKIGRIASERRPHLTNQVIGDPGVPEQAWATENGLASFAGYPLVVDNRLVGVMAMFSRYPLDARTLEAMSSVSRHVALGIEHKEIENRAVQLAAVVESSNDAIIRGTLDGIITSWNDGAEALYGYTAAEAVGQRGVDLFVPPELREEAHDMFRRVLQGEHAPAFETRRLRKDGGTVYVSMAMSPIRDAAGTVEALASISRDITARKMAEDALRRSEENHRALFDTNPLPSWVFDVSTLKFLEVNQAAVAHYGHSREEFLSMSVLDIRPEEDIPRFLAASPACGAARDFTKNWRHRKKDGTLIDVEVNHVETQFCGRPARLVVANDVTERRRTEQALRESEARYQRIADNVPGMVFRCVRTKPGEFIFTFVSESCREIYGLESKEILANARLVLDIVHPEDRTEFEQSIAISAATLNPWTWQGRIYKPFTKEVRYLQGTSRPERQPNGDIAWDGIVMDVTERRQAEEDRRAKEEAQRANAAKSEFLSRISHELRTPLNAILGFGQLLQYSALGLQETLSVKHILKAGSHLLGLIDEVLDLSRAETGELHLTRGKVDLDELIQDCMDLVCRQAEAGDITCEVKLPPDRPRLIWTDEQRLRQMLLNLLSNAIKYNQPGGTVAVSSAKTASRRLRLTVTDTGQGISAEGIEKLFVPFVRLEQRYGDVEGTGLGLAVSRQIAVAMGGGMGVESTPGQGSAFWIELPLESAEAEKSMEARRIVAPLPPPAHEPTAATLLYVEDNHSNLQVIQMLLARTRPSWKLVTATDGNQGLEQARRVVPDLILLDLELPGLPGEEVLTELRADAVTHDVPVIVLSADATAASRERLLEGGADAYTSKPFQAESLLRLLDEFMLERCAMG